jgi:hypothetical protein
MDECGGNLAVNEQVEEPVQIVANGESDDETQVEAPKPVKKKVAPIQKVQRPKQTLKKVSQARLALDSDSDAEITIEPVKEAKPPQQKRARIIDSDSE